MILRPIVALFIATTTFARSNNSTSSSIGTTTAIDSSTGDLSSPTPLPPGINEVGQINPSIKLQSLQDFSTHGQSSISVSPSIPSSCYQNNTLSYWNPLLGCVNCDPNLGQTPSRQYGKGEYFDKNVLESILIAHFIKESCACMAGWIVDTSNSGILTCTQCSSGKVKNI